MANEVVVRFRKCPGRGWRPVIQVRRGRRRTGVRAGTRPAPPWYTLDWGDVVGLNPFEWGPVTNIDTRSARHVVGEGALRGRSPRTREGRLGPTARNCSSQWSVVKEGAIADSELMGDWTWLGWYLRYRKGRRPFRDAPFLIPVSTWAGVSAMIRG